MKNSKQQRLSRRAGFTLLEIMLVIVIIGVIATIAISGLDVVSTGNQAKRTATTTLIGTLSTAVQRYYLDVGKMPPNLEALVNGGGTKNWKGPYLKKIKEDSWGDAFTYTSSGATFEIKSAAGGSEGGPISSNDL